MLTEHEHNIHILSKFAKSVSTQVTISIKIKVRVCLNSQMMKIWKRTTI